MSIACLSEVVLLPRRIFIPNVGENAILLPVLLIWKNWIMRTVYYIIKYRVKNHLPLGTMTQL